MGVMAWLQGIKKDQERAEPYVGGIFWYPQKGVQSGQHMQKIRDFMFQMRNRLWGNKKPRLKKKGEKTHNGS